ncbi:Protein CBG17087 [Caenorhabditis briggsae]|uniref:Protein CBG17087 n=1 Tax=Caenorhabditis briggsae TaxID=6238 RepID=A8XQE9_CAEBR|nr:Protein CBG17087 [Caenorhabditis briggsae]CAP34874.1 Protein CBG17087 [Caenorhabditis briggsae]
MFAGGQRGPRGPLGVLLETGCDYHLAICILLTILGYIPGIIYAIFVIIDK